MSEVDPLLQRQFALEVVRQLRGRGYVAYWAGGCVRDQLLGLTPKDYDVATDATPNEIRHVFGRRRTLFIGAAFGVVSVLGPQGAGQVEVATFRQDLSYSDGRHPDAVRYSTPQEDASRRDFTMNGLFFDPLDEEVIDFVEGRADLERQVVRAIGDPRQRFAEDKLRMLRAVRFAAGFGFELDRATRDAIEAMAGEIDAVSAERVAQEMRSMLTGSTRRAAVEMLFETGLLAELLPEVVALRGQTSEQGELDLWQETLALLEQLRSPSFPLALAALLLGTDQAGGVATVRDVAERWRLSNKESERSEWLVRHRDALTRARRLRWSRLQPLLVAPGIEELIELHRAQGAVQGRGDEDAEFCLLQLERPRTELDPAPLLSGEDLKRHGVPRGPIYRQLLAAVREAQLDRRIASREEALELVDRLRTEWAAEGS